MKRTGVQDINYQKKKKEKKKIKKWASNLNRHFTVDHKADNKVLIL